MKKISIPKNHDVSTYDMLPEYNFDYQKARPNRFADQIGRNQLVVVLDPDISEVFTTPESVNTLLRTLITTMHKVAK